MLTLSYRRLMTSVMLSIESSVPSNVVSLRSNLYSNKLCELNTKFASYFFQSYTLGLTDELYTLYDPLDLVSYIPTSVKYLAILVTFKM